MVSYLTGHPSRDVIVAGRQALTIEWWTTCRERFEVFVCALNGMDYLVTWNCTHLANATLRRQVERFLEAAGFVCPVICTPEELMEA